MTADLLPTCLGRCVEILADERAQKWREAKVVESFEQMLERNATVFDIELSFDAICFEAVTIWVDESMLLLSEARWDFGQALKTYGVPPCLWETDLGEPEMPKHNYIEVDDCDPDLDELSVLEQDALGKDCDTCRDAGKACNGCSVYLLEYLYK